MTELSSISISFSIDKDLPFISFTSLSVRTKFDSNAAAGSRVATTQRRFTAHVQYGHVVTMCTLALHFLCISSSDNRGSDTFENLRIAL